MTIAICTPTRDSISAFIVFDLMNLKTKENIFFATALGSILPQQRTSLVLGARASGASHILFIDSDMRFPPHTVDLLKSSKKDIIGVNCKHRQDENKWTSGVSSENVQGIQSVSTVGFGVTLIRLDVFSMIKEPWFATPYDGTRFISDDVFFCRKTKESGIDIWIDHDLSQDIRHIGIKEYAV